MDYNNTPSVPFIVNLDHLHVSSNTCNKADDIIVATDAFQKYILYAEFANVAWTTGNNY